MKKAQIVLAQLVVFGIAASASPAHASGSMAAPGSAAPDTYTIGKSVYFKQVTCSRCPYAGRGKDATDATLLRDQINASDSKIKLDSDEREAVNRYLTERFRLPNAAMPDKKTMDNK
jgi:hypothetical protein